MEDKSKLYLWIVIGAVLGLIAVYFIFGGKVKLGGPSYEPVSLPGLSPVSEGGVVLSPSGKAADNAAVPGLGEAPRQSAPISEKEVPSSAIKLEVSASGFSPGEFTVSAGAVVTLSLTSTDSESHVFKFEDQSLNAVTIGIGGGQTRVLNFNAPEKPGEYAFRCDVPGHKARGEVGKMIVE